jgi:hypothetical protein
MRYHYILVTFAIASLSIMNAAPVPADAALPFEILKLSENDALDSFLANIRDDIVTMSDITELNNLFDIPQLDIDDGALLNEDEAWSEAGRR